MSELEIYFTLFLSNLGYACHSVDWTCRHVRGTPSVDTMWSSSRLDHWFPGFRQVPEIHASSEIVVEALDEDVLEQWSD